MNLQKDLIQHIAVLTVAPGYLNFADPRSSGILHVGLEETQQLLRDCLGILAVEDTAEDTDIFQRVGRGREPALRQYAEVFRTVYERIGALLHEEWKDDLAARYAIEPAISELDSFLSGEHWYDIDRAMLLAFPNGSFYRNCSKVCVNCMTNWHCASLFFSPELARCTRSILRERFQIEGAPLSVSELDPPKDYLWRARTYAPQSPQSMINYWEAVLPGSRRVRIRQMVSQTQ